MASPPPRVPPKFVPTLTTVLQQPSSDNAPGVQPDIEPAPPTLLAPLAPALADGGRPFAAFQNREEEQAALSPDSAFQLEEALLHRVLQRVDLSLEARLTDAVSAAVQQQLDAMLPRLREEVETVLRTLLIEAIAQELSAENNTGSATGLTSPSQR